MKVGLFFGSFNPIHIGHLIIADYIAQYSELQEIWLVVSPHNPLKHKASLARGHDRLHLVQMAIEDNPRLKASGIEFLLPKPSYTIDTLAYLHEKYPEKDFSLIIGSDNLESIHKWKTYELLLENYDFFVYQRRGFENYNHQNLDRVTFMEAPLLDISSTMVRQRIADGKSIRYLVPDPVCYYIENSNMYKPSKS